MKAISRAAHSFGKLISAEGGSRFRRNFLTVAKANIFAQALGVVFSPVLTRLYEPADFGTLTTFSALLGVLAAFCTWRFEWSIPNAESDSDASSLASLALISLFLVAGISFLLFWQFAPDWTFWAGFQTLGWFVLLIPAALVGQGSYHLLQAWFIRRNDLTAVSRSTISRKVSGTGLSLAGGIASLGSLGLVLSSVISIWIGSAVLLRHAATLLRSVLSTRFSDVVKALKDFGAESCVSSAVAVVKVASVLGIPILLINYYSLTELGWFALANRIALLPSGFVTGALGQSFWSEASQLVQTDRRALRALYLRTARRLILVAVLPTLVCLAGPLFVGPVFGEGWDEAGYVMLALAPWIASQIIVQPITHLIVHRKQHWKLYTDGFQLVAVAIVIHSSATSGAGFVSAIFFISIVASVAYAILFFLNLRCLPR